MILLWRYESPLGRITMAGEGDALVGLWLEGQKHFASTLGPDATEGWLPVFDEVKRWLDVYFNGAEPGFTPRLDFSQSLRARMALPRWETAFFSSSETSARVRPG